MRIVFLKSMVLPRPSVRWPSSNTCSSTLKTSGCAFSISSSSTTAVGVALDALGELAALLVPDVARGRADQLGDRVLLHVLGHVEAHQVALAAEQERGQAARHLGLADAGRAQEQERAHRPVRVLEPGARAADRARHGADGALLRHDALVQLLLHAQELLGLLFLDRGDRDPRPLARPRRRCRPCVTSWRALAAHVPVLADDVQVLALRHFLVAEEAAALGGVGAVDARRGSCRENSGTSRGRAGRRAASRGCPPRRAGRSPCRAGSGR